MILKLENSLTQVGKEPEDWSVAFGLLKFTNLYKKWFLRISNTIFIKFASMRKMTFTFLVWSIQHQWGQDKWLLMAVNNIPPKRQHPPPPPCLLCVCCIQPKLQLIKINKDMTWRGLIGEPPRWTKIKENTIIPTIPTIVKFNSMIFVSGLYYLMFCSPPWSWDLPVHEL